MYTLDVNATALLTYICGACKKRQKIKGVLASQQLYPDRPMGWLPFDLFELTPCIVPFCRKNCLIIPGNAKVSRASGDCLCEVCEQPFRDHPTFAYLTGMKHVVKACDGRYLHL